MSNWTAITQTDLTDAKASLVISTATGLGWSASSAIAGVVARIRSAISPGNSLDQDVAKIPNSLKELAVRMVIRSAKNHAEIPLTANEDNQNRDDNSWLIRMTDVPLRFEVADNPNGTAEMQPQSSPSISKPRRRFSRNREDGI